MARNKIKMKKIISIALILLFSMQLLLFNVSADNSKISENTDEYKDSLTLKEEFLNDSKERNINLSSNANGVFVRPEDYLTNKQLTSADVTKNIDKIFDDVLAMSFDTIFLYTSSNKMSFLKLDGYEYSPNLDGFNFDIVEYFISKAKEKNIYIVGIFDVLSMQKDNEVANPDYINADVIDIVTKKAVKTAEKYKFDGLLLDNYYNIKNEYSYSGYISSGSGIGLTNFLFENSESLISSISYAIKSTDYSIAVGLLCDAVWANTQTDEKGSNTNSETEFKTRGNIDILNIINDKAVDFISVKAEGATDDKKIPFNDVASWWSNVTKDSGTILYLVHSNEKICTDNEGFKAPDQILRQIIAAKNIENYKGSIFSSYSALLENREKSTEILIKYIKQQVKGDLILKDLYMTRPNKLEFNTYEKTVMFTGTSDPNFELKINDKAIDIDKETGNFSMQYELQNGVNKFKFKHKATEVTYTITKKIKVLKSVTPNSTVTGDGGMKIQISANAYDGADVWAMINGKKVELSVRENDQDEANRESVYKDYYGYYTLPDSSEKEQNLGKVIVYASYNGTNKESMAGGVIKVNKKISELPPDISDDSNSSGDSGGTGPGQITPPSGKMLQITSQEAETFPTTVLDDDSVPTNYPYPKGSYDYIHGNIVSYSWKGTVFTYYNLKSNRRVYVKDTKVIEDTLLINSVASNSISSTSVSQNGKFTDITIKQKYKTPPIISLSDLNFSGDYTISNFNPEYMLINLPYISDVSNIDFQNNPVFSSAVFQKTNANGINKHTLKLKFKSGRGFSGAISFFDNSGNLVIRVRNPLGGKSASNQFGYSLENVKIAISSGHGGVDPGALGFNGVNEKELNLAITDLVAKYLREIGAEVVVLPHNMPGQNISLQQRMINAKNVQPDILLNIHHNSAAAITATGVETYYFAPFTKPLAKSINDRLAGYYKNTMYGTGSNKYNRGDKFSWRYMTRDMTFPAILIEYGFVNNRVEFDKLVKPENQDGLAKATVFGIIDYVKQMS